MNTFISASSPLLQYKPCKACGPSNGFQSGSDFSGRDYNGTESGMITRVANSSVSFKFTGTGISFDLSYSQSQNTSSFLPSLKINGSLPSSSQKATPTSIKNLPLGEHSFELTFTTSATTSTNTTTSDWIRVNGVSCDLGFQTNNQSTNETIDDTAWRDWKILLTPGWNMLEKDVSNYIDLEQLQAEMPTASRDYNNSISWTEQADAANEIHFQGSAIWVHGIVGDKAGSYEVILDNLTQGIFDASGGPRVYNTILYHTSNLVDTNHTISLRNIEEGKRLSFDRLVTMSGLIPTTNSSGAAGPAPIASMSGSVSPIEVSSYYPTSSSTPTSPSLGEQGYSTSLSGGTIAGIVVAACIVILAFLLTWVFACLRKRKDCKRNEETEVNGGNDDREKSQTTFFRFSSRAASPAPAHPFHPLPSPKNFQPQALVQAQLPQRSQHSMPTPALAPTPDPAPRKATTSRLFNFSSPTPSLRSFIQNHTTSSMISEKDSNGNNTSFLKLAGNRYSRSNKNHHQHHLNKNGDNDIEEDLRSAHHLNIPKKKSINGLNIGNPQPIHLRREKSADYVPSLASGTEEVPLPPTKPLVPQQQQMSNDSLRPPNDVGMDMDNPIRSNSVLSSTSTTRRETISPLVAALSGKTFSPLSELSRSTSKRVQPGIFSHNRRKGSISMVDTVDTRKCERGGYSTNDNDIDVETEKPDSNYTLKTERTNWENENENGANGGDNGILSMYAKFPPGSSSQRNSQRNTTFINSYYESDIPDDGLSGVGVALGSPMQDNNFEWEGKLKNQEINHNQDEGEEEEEEFKPPTRRFLGLGDRPKSGVSNKSGKTVSSIGSGWRYM